MTDKISYFIDCGVPVNNCNFDCEYCFVQKKSIKYLPFPYPVEHIAKALSPERFGGIGMLNLCGNGETLLHPELVSLARLLLEEGHFVSIVTNGVINNAMNELFSFPPELAERLFIKFSLHYIELKKRNLLKRFFNNVTKAKTAGISFTVELVAARCNISYIDDIKAICIEKLGAICHVTDARDENEEGIPRITTMSIEEHQALWAQFDSALFEYRQETWGINRKDQFCNSGNWAFNLSLGQGLLRQCYKGTLQNIYEDLDEPIHSMATGNHCPYPHCFNSHVWDCLAGVIPSIDSPSYAELRNRICADGTEWLSPRYKAVFNRRICENHEEYDETRKIFTNGIMTLAYRNYEPDAAFASVVESYIMKGGYSTVAVQGSGRISEWFLSHIKDTVPFSGNSDADAVIITEYKNLVIIKKDLAGKICIPVINILDLPLLKNKL